MWQRSDRPRREPVGGSALDTDTFTMDAWHGFTRGMAGPSRAAIFFQLPDDLQRIGWQRVRLDAETRDGER